MTMHFAHKTQGKLTRLCLLSIACFFLSLHTFAQNERQKIAVFTPLYLDSAFDATGKFRFEKTGARMSSAGLDFYYGVQLALDSLKKRNAQLEIFVRSEEHTSELQSQSNLVCRLLLEKKKTRRP